MKGIEQFLSKISLVKKIFIIFLGCVILPLLLQNLFYFTETEQNIQGEIYQQMTSTLANIGNKVDASLHDALSVAVKYHNDISLYRALDRRYTSDIDYLIAYQEIIEPLVKNELPFHLQIDEVTFFTDNATIFSGALVRKTIPFDAVSLGQSLVMRSLWPLADDHSVVFRVCLRYIHYEKNSQRSVSIVRNMAYYPDYDAFEKVLKIDLNPTYYNTLLSDTALFDNLLLTDAEGRVLFCANTYRQSGNFDTFDPDMLAPGSVVLSRPVKDLPLTLHGYYNSSMISNQFRKSMMGVLVISGIGIGIALLFLIFVGRNLTRRTNAIVAKAAQIAKGDFTDNAVRIDLAGDDEIANIERSIQSLSFQLQSFIDQEYRAKLLQAELEREVTQAKLQALQGQVNPHFLFNALESVRLNALDQPPEVTAWMIRHISRMFRYLVDWDGDIVRLRQELDFLREFLQIQQFRFGDDFQYVIDVEDAAHDCLLPKLILQPLVENACVHGIETTGNDKRIEIAVWMEGDGLCMRVSDNGGGMRPETLAALRTMLDGGKPSSESVGLYNVYQRLALQYRDNFAFTIESEAGHGTVCTVRIPAQHAAQ